MTIAVDLGRKATKQTNKHSVSFIAIDRMVLEILCVEPIYPQYSRVLETCLALRYWFFEVLGSVSVKPFKLHGGFSADKYIFFKRNQAL